MHYEKPFTGWNVLAILIGAVIIGYCVLYATVWVLKYFWAIV